MNVFLCSFFLQSLFSAALNREENRARSDLGAVLSGHDRGHQRGKAIPRPSKPPHVFFILVDDLGYGDVAFNLPDESAEFHAEVQTPNMDWLVDQGIHLRRHYVHSSCQQTRTSAQSGRLPVHVQMQNNPPFDPHAGMPRNMTGIAERLLEAGYKTHYVGKWDVGMATHKHTPKGRGYQTSLGYFNHDNDRWTQKCVHRCGCEDHADNPEVTDFWEDDGPAADKNGTDFQEFIFLNRMEKIIENHDPNDPLFLFYAPHVAHCPLQVPEQYLNRFSFITQDQGRDCANADGDVPNVLMKERQPPGFKFHCRRQYRATVNLLDDIIGHVAQKLIEHDLWDNLLLVFTSDNGGPPGHGATNHPLRGGKGSYFEGGVRAAAFVSGGVVEARKGTKEDGVMHIADWYTTLIKMAGLNVTDRLGAQHKLPPVDGIDMWPLLSGGVQESPRKELPMSKDAIIEGKYKLLRNTQSMSLWQGPLSPNDTVSHKEITANSLDCGHQGCLFNVLEDPGEHNNLIELQPERAQAMSTRLDDLSTKFFVNTDVNTYACPPGVEAKQCACWMAVNYYGGFMGPYQI